MTDLRTRIDRLYNGRSKNATRFRFVLLVFDLATVTFFVVASMVPQTPVILAVDYVIATLLIIDFSLRLWVAPKKLRYLMDPITIADVIVIGTLLLPVLLDNWAFLRVMRALRLLRSYRVLRDLRSTFSFFKRNEDIITSVVNLLVFIFLITALVFVLGRDQGQINNYVDALYFTVTTLTTTGFGDVTLSGTSGRLLAVVIMVLGVALFLRLVQTIFRPQKVRHTCPECGLNRHDSDAVHCKHCGHVVNIETEGA